MAVLQKRMNSSGKSRVNVAFFLISIIIVTAILPHQETDNILKYTGSFIVISSSYLVLYLFLYHFRSEVLMVIRKTLFIIIIILIFLILTKVVVSSNYRNLIYIVPFAVIPIMVRTFYDARLALFTLLITLMLAGLIVPDPFQFVFMNFISGMVAIFSMVNIYRKARLLFIALMVFISYSALYVGTGLMVEGNFENILFIQIIVFAVNSVLLLISHPVIFYFEKDFLFLSDATLLELADTNQPLLRKLADEAPGSFQHSLQVSNLAEEAARIIGANLLLVRTGALYHDIGKIAYPGYFTENQSDGASPHENLDPLESARVIINHVKNGVVLAKNYKLPVQIIDFIRMHHGTTTAYYFLKKYYDMHPGITGMEKEFTYPGPKPFSKETAVVMMADAVEASSRSLGKYSDEAIGEMVERVLYLQENAGQFSEVPLTFKDISGIKAAFKKRLANMHHVRIEYPDREK